MNFVVGPWYNIMCENRVNNVEIRSHRMLESAAKSTSYKTELGA